MATFACPHCGEPVSVADTVGQGPTACGACRRHVPIPESVNRAKPQTVSSSSSGVDLLASTTLATMTKSEEALGLLVISMVGLVVLAILGLILWAIGGWLLVVKSLLWLAIVSCAVVALLLICKWQFDREAKGEGRAAVTKSKLLGSAIILGAFSVALLTLGAVCFGGAYLVVAIPIVLIAGCGGIAWGIGDTEKSSLSKWAKVSIKFGLSALVVISIGYMIRYGPYRNLESRYNRALLKKDFYAAEKVAIKMESRSDQPPGLGEYLGAYALLESKRLDEALDKVESAVQKSDLREHQLLKAQILFRMGRELEAETALKLAERLPLNRRSSTEWPDSAYVAVFVANSNSIWERGIALLKSRRHETLRSVAQESKCLTISCDVKEVAEMNAMATAAPLLFFFACVKDGELRAAMEVEKVLPKDQQARIREELWKPAMQESGVDLVTHNLMCWLPCLTEENSLKDVPKGNFTQMRAVISQTEHSAKESQNKLAKALAEYESSNASGSSDARLIEFSKTNMHLLGEYADAFSQLRDWSYSAEVLNRRAASGELLVEAMIRGYFGDPIGTAKEFQGARDSTYMGLARILDQISDVERRRANLYKDPNGALSKLIPQATSKETALGRPG